MRILRALSTRGTSALKKAESGQALVEFALCSVVLLMVLFGIMEFGRAIAVEAALANAAYEGAHVAALYRSNNDAFDPTYTRVKEQSAMVGGLPRDSLTLTPPGDWNPGTDVTLTVKYQFCAITPILLGVVSCDGSPPTGGIPMESVAVMSVR